MDNNTQDLSTSDQTCADQIENIKKNANNLIQYQHQIIKEQSNQLLALTDSIKGSTGQEYNSDNNYQYYIKIHFILFILLFVLVVFFCIYRTYL